MNLASEGKVIPIGVTPRFPRSPTDLAIGKKEILQFLYVQLKRGRPRNPSTSRLCRSSSGFRVDNHCSSSRRRLFPGGGLVRDPCGSIATKKFGECISFR